MPFHAKTRHGLHKKSTPSEMLFSISKYQLFLIKLSSIINQFTLSLMGLLIFCAVFVLNEGEKINPKYLQNPVLNLS